MSKKEFRTLKDVKRIGDFAVVVMDDLKKNNPEMFREDGSMRYNLFEKNIRPHNFIYVRNDQKSLSFTFQHGSVAENGVNGVRVDTLIETAIIMLDKLNDESPSGYNGMALDYLNVALNCLRDGKAYLSNSDTDGVE